MLKDVDVYVLLKLVALRNQGDGVQSVLAADIGVSPSVVSRALLRAAEVRLYSPLNRKVNTRNLQEALTHGARYFLAPKMGSEVRGLPTAWAAPPLVGEIASAEVLPPVWPDPQGEVRGLSVEPLHPSAPRAARRDALFYELLALVDAIRIGGARERSLAERELRRRMEGE